MCKTAQSLDSAVEKAHPFRRQHLVLDKSGCLMIGEVEFES